MGTITRTRTRCKPPREININLARKFFEETAVMCVQAADSPYENEIVAALRTLRKMPKLLRSTCATCGVRPDIVHSPISKHGLFFCAEHCPGCNEALGGVDR